MTYQHAPLAVRSALSDNHRKALALLRGVLEHGRDDARPPVHENDLAWWGGGGDGMKREKSVTRTKALQRGPRITMRRTDLAVVNKPVAKLRDFAAALVIGLGKARAALNEFGLALVKVLVGQVRVARGKRAARAHDMSEVRGRTPNKKQTRSAQAHLVLEIGRHARHILAKQIACGRDGNGLVLRAMRVGVKRAQDWMSNVAW